MPPTLEPDSSTLHGWFDRHLPPVLTVDPGTTVRFRTLDSGWSAGPVEVRGARPGMVLEVRIDDVVPGAWGTTYAGMRTTAWNARLGLEGPAVLAWGID